MKNVKRRSLCILCTLALLLSMVVVPGLAASSDVGNKLQKDFFDTVSPDDILADLNYTKFSQPYGAGVGDTVVADPESAVGYAAKFSYAGRAASGDAGRMNSMIRTGDQSLMLRMTTGAPAPDNDVPVGIITVSELQANAKKGGYALYKFDDVNIQSAVSADNMFYMFDCWGFQSTLGDLANVLAGKSVDVYLSMKVTGDVTNTTDNTPSYYIDRIVITTANPTITGHTECKFGNYVYNGDATADSNGTMTGTCVYGCGNTDVIAASHVQLFTASNFYFADNFSGDGLYNDPDSVMNTVLKREAYVDGASRPNLVLTGVNLEFHPYPDSGAGGIGSLHAGDIKANQGYQLYKFSFENYQVDSAASVVYMFNDWQLQSGAMAEALKTYNGKNIDIYLSMKVTGDVTGETASADSPDNWPVYYIDRVMIVEQCSFGGYTSDNNASGCDDGTKHRTCSVCGLTEYAIDEGSASGHTLAEVVAEQYCVTEATCQQAGVYYKSCTICGKAGTETFETEKLSHNFVDGVCTMCGTSDKHITGTALTLGSILQLDISVNTATLPEGEYKLRVSIGEDTDYQELYGEYKALIPAHRLYEDVTIRLMSGEETLETQVWRMAEYAADLKNVYGENTKMMTLLDALGNYGTYAAYYNANGAGEAPGVAAVEAVTTADLKPYKQKVTANAAPALKASAALYLDDACDIRVKFNAAAWGENKLYINGSEVSVTQEDQKMVYVIGDLTPQQWDDTYTIEVKMADGTVVFSVEYSVLSYAWTQLNGSLVNQAGLNDLLKSIFLYNQAANTYAGE